MSLTTKFPIVVLISGYGSNLQAMIEAIRQGLAVEIRAVISNCAQAFGLQRAQQVGISTHVISPDCFPSGAAFDQALLEQIDFYQPQLIVLAGFMRRLGTAIIQHYHGRIINIHPSLLPKYPGLNTHRRVLEAGDEKHGVTIHFVNEKLDNGPIICQASFPVNSIDSEESLKRRVQEVEHHLYPQVLDWFAKRRLQLTSKGVILDNVLITASGKQYNVGVRGIEFLLRKSGCSQ